MTRLVAPLCASALLASCADIPCPEGTALDPMTRMCARIDGGQGQADIGAGDAGLPDAHQDDTGPRDLGWDAGPCGMPCTGGQRCNETSGECVDCLSDGHCGDATPVCDTSTGTCVGCVDGTDCTATGRPFCVGTQCVGCRTNTDCPVSTPVCSPTTHTCGPCTARTDCNGRATAPACNTTTGACTLCDVPNESADCGGLRCFNQVSCTQCRAMTVAIDCQSPTAARCDSTGTCAACTSNADCGHISGGRNRCDAGTCVQCTVATESADCGTKSCNPATRTCTTTDRFTRQQCQSCVADNDCLQGGATVRCIRMNYQGADRGGYCLRAAPGCVRPFGVIIPAISLSGAASANYCGVDQSVTTCDAVLTLRDGLQCPSGSATECMAAGALCETVSGLANQCTYPCGGAAACLPSEPGASCNAGYCGS